LAEICTGAVIIERGKILRAGTLQEILSRNGKATRTVVLRPLDRVEELLKTLLETPGVEDARPADGADGAVEADLSDASNETCCALLETVMRAGFRILEYRPRRADLEQIFLDVTRGEVQ
jgi:ABC-2 type transport system ATP-binding protein